MRETITVDLTDAQELLAQHEQRLVEQQERYDQAAAREKKAWGPSTRANPMAREKWEGANREMAKLFPTVLSTTVAVQETKARVENLKGNEEIRVRYALALEWLK